MRAAGRSPALRFYLWLVPLLTIAALAVAVFRSPHVQADLRQGALWILALFVVELFPVPVWRDIQVSLGFPVLLFLGVLYEPASVGIFALAGSGDPREFTGGSDVLRSLFNRSQVAVAGTAAAAVIHAISPATEVGPRLLAAAVVAGIAHLAVNTLFVGVAARLDYGVRLRDIVRRMPVGNPWLFETAYLGVGVLGAVMAGVYVRVGAWAMVGLVPPMIAIRHLIKVSSELRRAEDELRREAELERLADQLTAERQADRRRVASVLHDEVGAHLAASILFVDEATLRLNGSVPEIVPSLRSAVEAGREAQAQVRHLIGELLQAPGGAEGLQHTLETLLEEQSHLHGVEIERELEPVEAPRVVDELLFRATREAVRNAVRHGKAGHVEVVLRNADGTAVLTVADDGSGFDPGVVEHAEGHFGLRLLRERIELCGGSLSVTSGPERGTIIRAEIPLAPTPADHSA